MRFSARIFATLFTFLLFFFVAKTSFAQVITQPPVPASTSTSSTDANVPKNLHTYSQSVVIEVLSSIICQIAGVDPINPAQACLGVNTKTNKIGYVQGGGGALGVLTKGIAFLYTPALHTSTYISYLHDNFGVAKKTYAQGVGFNAINPLIPLWTIFRNITYSLFVFLFVLIGIGIMLRTKIDPRTVMTIQNQIPKIIIGLILITFSFAIAGFLIDLMYISIYVIYSVLSGAGDVASMSPVAIQGQNVLNAAGGLGVFNISHNIALSGKDAINGLLGVDSNPLSLVGDIGSFVTTLFGVGNWADFHVVNMVYSVISLTTALKMASLIPCAGASVPILGGLLCGGQTAVEAIPFFVGIRFFLTDILPYLLIFMVIIISILYTLFKVFFMLLKAYIFVILDVIFAPFWIVSGLVPGISEGKGFGPWIRDLVANLAVFPAVYTMFLLANIIGNAFVQSSTTGSRFAFAPPLLGNPLAGGFIGYLISLGLILMTPEVAKMIRNAIKAPSMPGGLGGLAVGAGVVSKPFGGIKRELFGKNPMTGEAKVGSAFLGRKLGAVGQVLSGGGTKFTDENGNRTRIPLIRVPIPNAISRTIGRTVGTPITQTRRVVGKGTATVQQPLRNAQASIVSGIKQRMGLTRNTLPVEKTTVVPPAPQQGQVGDQEKVHRDINALNEATEKLRRLAQEKEENDNK